MSLDKQIIREYGAYADLIDPGNAIELQLYMIGVANDTDELIFRSDDGFHRVLDSGTTALSEHSIPFINATGKAAQDNTNLQFNDSTDTLTTKNMVASGTLGVTGASTITTLDCDEITVADGHGINLQEDITFLGATTENQIKMPDALEDALSFLEGANKYQTFDTRDGQEYVNFPKPVGIGDAVFPADTSLFDVRQDTNGATFMRIKNNTAGTGARAYLNIQANSGQGFLAMWDDGYTGNTELADKFTLYGSTSATALLLGAEHASGEIQFYAGGLASGDKVARFDDNHYLKLFLPTDNFEIQDCIDDPGIDIESSVAVQKVLQVDYEDGTTGYIAIFANPI